jgi:hypothetical protein
VHDLCAFPKVAFASFSSVQNISTAMLHSSCPRSHRHGVNPTQKARLKPDFLRLITLRHNMCLLCCTPSMANALEPFSVCVVSAQLHLVLDVMACRSPEVTASNCCLCLSTLSPVLTAVHELPYVAEHIDQGALALSAHWSKHFCKASLSA